MNKNKTIKLLKMKNVYTQSTTPSYLQFHLYFVSVVHPVGVQLLIIVFETYSSLILQALVHIVELEAVYGKSTQKSLGDPLLELLHRLVQPYILNLRFPVHADKVELHGYGVDWSQVDVCQRSKVTMLLDKLMVDGRRVRHVPELPYKPPLRRLSLAVRYCGFVEHIQVGQPCHKGLPPLGGVHLFSQGDLEDAELSQHPQDVQGLNGVPGRER